MSLPSALLLLCLSTLGHAQALPEALVGRWVPADPAAAAAARTEALDATVAALPFYMRAIARTRLSTLIPVPAQVRVELEGERIRLSVIDGSGQARGAWITPGEPVTTTIDTGPLRWSLVVGEGSITQVAAGSGGDRVSQLQLQREQLHFSQQIRSERLPVPFNSGMRLVPAPGSE